MVKKFAVNDTFIQELIDADGTKIKIGFVSVCIPSNLKVMFLMEMFSQKQKELI